MANYCVVNGNLYDGASKTLEVRGGALLRVKASIPSNGSVVYSVLGKLTSNDTPKTITGLSDNGWKKTVSISDDGVYVFDVTGYHSVTVSMTSVEGNVKVFGTIFAE